MIPEISGTDAKSTNPCCNSSMRKKRSCRERMCMDRSKGFQADPELLQYLVNFQELEEGEDEVEIQEGDHLRGEIVLGSHDG